MYHYVFISELDASIETKKEVRSKRRERKLKRNTNYDAEKNFKILFKRFIFLGVT